MKPRPHDPRRLDVAAFAAAGASLEGVWPLAAYTRLVDEHPAEAATPAGEVRWRAHGVERARFGAEASQVWLEIEAQAEVLRRCQRCLQPVALALRVQRRVRFVDGEAQAAELDADSEDDVLALDRARDLHALLEDELLLALPMVPRHAHCAAPAAAAAGEAAPVGVAQSDDESPFAALAQWRARERRR